MRKSENDIKRLSNKKCRKENTTNGEKTMNERGKEQRNHEKREKDRTMNEDEKQMMKSGSVNDTIWWKERRKIEKESKWLKKIKRKQEKKKKEMRKNVSELRNNNEWKRKIAL